MQHATQEAGDNPPLLLFTIGPNDLDLLRLTALLQAGFYFTAVEGDSISSVLQRLPGFTAEYIERALQTIFLNGTAIDDLSTPLTGANASLALSAAMPGLAGAILRRNSPHAALRKSYSGPQSKKRGNPLEVVIKLFNQPAVERGPALLKHGVHMKASDLVSFFSLRPALLRDAQRISINGASLNADQVLERLASENLVTMRAA